MAAHIQKPHLTDAFHANQVQEAQRVNKELRDLLSPSKFSRLSDTAFPQRPHVKHLLEEYHIERFPYCEVVPDNSTIELVNFARDAGSPIHTTLYVHISIPKKVLKISEPVRLKLSVDFHGGGGVLLPILIAAKHGLTLAVYWLCNV